DPAWGAFQPSSHHPSDTFQPVPLCFNQGLAASSPSPADVSGPLPSSCSAPQLSPVPALTHSPAPVLDPRTCSWRGEEWPCPTPCPCPSPASCCVACGCQHGDPRLPQCVPCPSTDCMDCLPTLPVPEDFFRRDRGWDICYT
ncbi:COLC2 protein, partial [Grallaria varia]|nr:COLC2 protein [Grallaria varia]